MNTKENKLLIIDDSPVIIDHVVSLLKDDDYINNVSYAVNIADAKKFLTTTVPEVILLDINLGADNGLDILPFVKQNYPSVQVIMFTNQTNKFYKDKSIRLGAADFLDKSFDFSRLPDVIASVIA